MEESKVEGYPAHFQLDHALDGVNINAGLCFPGFAELEIRAKFRHLDELTCQFVHLITVTTHPHYVFVLTVLQVSP